MQLHERFMSFVGHERCPLLQELNNQPSRLLLTLKGVVNEQLLLSRMGLCKQTVLLGKFAGRQIEFVA